MHERQVTSENCSWDDFHRGEDSGTKVAIAVADGYKPYALEYHDRDTVQLAASGRWCERMVSIKDGNKFIVVVSLCGYSGASQDPDCQKER